MQTVIIRHKVGDFNTWLKGDKERKEIFGSSVSSYRAFHDTDDPNSVLMVLEVNDLEKLVDNIGDLEVGELRGKHTLLSPTIVSIPIES